MTLIIISRRNSEIKLKRYVEWRGWGYIRAWEVWHSNAPRNKAQELNEDEDEYILVRIVYTWWHLVSNHYLENQLNHHLWWKIEVDWRSASLWRGPVTYEACLKWSENSWEDMMRNIKLATQWNTPAHSDDDVTITPPAAPLWIVETMHNLIRSVNTS